MSYYINLNNIKVIKSKLTKLSGFEQENIKYQELVEKFEE